MPFSVPYRRALAPTLGGHPRPVFGPHLRNQKILDLFIKILKIVCFGGFWSFFGGFLAVFGVFLWFVVVFGGLAVFGGVFLVVFASF